MIQLSHPYMAAINSWHPVCSYAVSILRAGVNFFLPFKSDSELVMCFINRTGQNGYVELLRVGHKKPCSFHWSFLKHSLLGPSYWKKPATNYEAQRPWKYSILWSSSHMERAWRMGFNIERERLRYNPEWKNHLERGTSSSSHHSWHQVDVRLTTQLSIYRILDP